MLSLLITYTPTDSTSTTPQSTTSTPTDSISTTPQSTTSIPIGVRGLIGICSIVFILLIYCCFAFAVAMRELSRMKKRRKKKAKHIIVDELDDFDDDEEIDEKNVDQLQSNDLLLTNEHAALVAMKNEVASESEAVASSRPTAVVTEARPSISVTSKEESKTEKGRDQESSKPAAVYTTKPRKKVEFVIELPLLNS